MNLDKIKTIPIVQVAAQHLGLSIDKNNKTKCFNLGAHKNSDAHASLSFDINKNRFKCFACGESGSVIDLVMEYKRLDLKEATRELSEAFFGATEQPKEHTLSYIKSWKLEKNTFDKLYNYGPYIKVRFRDPENRKNKLDLFFTKTSSGKFVKGRKCPPVLYNETELDSRTADPVLYVEGEGCVDILKSLGFLATTAGSAIITPKTFTSEMITKFVGRDVVIFPDNDGPGIKLISDLSGLIHSKVKTLRVVNIKAAWQGAFNEQLPPKFDIANFVEKYRENQR